MSETVAVEVEGRTLRLSNLDKVLYPEIGLTKGEIISYYTEIAPVLLPHLAGRPLTVKRYPNGVDGPFFYEKNASRGKPDWVRTVRLPVPGSTMNRDEIDYIVVRALPDLVWLANLAALELHTPQWTVGPRGGVRGADQLVLDLDPGAPAAIAECCQVALLLRDALAAQGLKAVAKTSGSKGMQLYAAIKETPSDTVNAYAHELAKQLEEEHPKLVVSRMTKSLRKGKVLVDWSQNNAAKTTVSVYSLRARPTATVSTPVTWDEVEAGADGQPLSFTQADVLARVADGDLFRPLLATRRPALR
ncbi:MAG TPA: non-homologous end-joining DNA ligase [Mycobacteriales bacterium]|nr:non-homologous end-joining DNA ligase [Mycobacteriales bacterium]